jgi:hypothetical protein
LYPSARTIPRRATAARRIHSQSTLRVYVELPTQ